MSPVPYTSSVLPGPTARHESGARRFLVRPFEFAFCSISRWFGDLVIESRTAQRDGLTRTLTSRLVGRAVPDLDDVVRSDYKHLSLSRLRRTSTPKAPSGGRGMDATATNTLGQTARSPFSIYTIPPGTGVPARRKRTTESVATSSGWSRQASGRNYFHRPRPRPRRAPGPDGRKRSSFLPVRRSLRDHSCRRHVRQTPP